MSYTRPSPPRPVHAKTLKSEDIELNHQLQRMRRRKLRRTRRETSCPKAGITIGLVSLSHCTNLLAERLSELLRHGNFQVDRQPQGLCLLPIPSRGACHSRVVYDGRLLCYGLAAVLVLRGALGQVLGKLSQAASGRQGPQDGVTDSRKGLEGVRAGVRVGQPSDKRLVHVKDQRLGLG
ncbi:hypothetical protein EJ07DRAFT_154086 [Lizonia empirigonia]|nr:hypothetical protein EJ07DRAFT_154086 [Lizonia empirigonia]